MRFDIDGLPQVSGSFSPSYLAVSVVLMAAWLAMLAFGHSRHRRLIGSGPGEPGTRVDSLRRTRSPSRLLLRPRTPAKRSFPTPRDALAYFARNERMGTGSYLAPDIGEYEMAEVDAVNGAFMLVRRTAIDEVGLFDEAYWMYGEDLDWCRRFAQAGWKVVYDGRVTALHLKGATVGRVRGFRLNWHFYRSMAIFYRRYEAGRNLPLDAAVFLGIAAKWIISTIGNSVRLTRNRVSNHQNVGGR